MPVTVTVRLPLPGGALSGLILEMLAKNGLTWTLRGPAESGASPPEIVTSASPTTRSNSAGTVASSRVAETNVVSSFTPFQTMSAPSTKSTPVTEISVLGAPAEMPPPNVRSATAVTRGRGFVKTNDIEFDVPPPGVGFTIDKVTLPTGRISESATSNCVSVTPVRSESEMN